MEADAGRHRPVVDGCARRTAGTASVRPPPPTRVTSYGHGQPVPRRPLRPGTRRPPVTCHGRCDDLAVDGRAIGEVGRQVHDAAERPRSVRADAVAPRRHDVGAPEPRIGGVRGRDPAASAAGPAPGAQPMDAGADVGEDDDLELVAAEDDLRGLSSIRRASSRGPAGAGTAAGGAARFDSGRTSGWRSMPSASRHERPTRLDPRPHARIVATRAPRGAPHRPGRCRPRCSS